MFCIGLKDLAADTKLLYNISSQNCKSTIKNGCTMAIILFINGIDEELFRVRDC